MITSTASTWHPSGTQSKGLMSVSTAGGQSITDKGDVCFICKRSFLVYVCVGPLECVTCRKILGHF